MQLLDVFAESAAGMKAVSSKGIAQILADGYVFFIFVHFEAYSYRRLFLHRGKKFPVRTVRGLFPVHRREVEHECMCEITNRALKWFYWSCCIL